MYGALLCLVANLMAVVVDHYDTRQNEARYKTFESLVGISGWTLFVLALILSFVQSNDDFVCENRVTLSVTNDNGELTAIAFNRHCALHSPTNDVEPSLQVAVIPTTSDLPAKFGNTALMNKTDIVRMYWTGPKLIIDYRRRNKSTGALSRPEVRKRAPVHVEFIDVK